MNFSDRVKKIKKEKNITNEALAEATGIPVSTLGKLLSGHTEEPKLSTVVAIAGALGCPVEFLATGKEAPAPLTAAEEAHLFKYRALDAHGARICDYIVEEEYLRVCAGQKPAAPLSAPEREPKAKLLYIPFFENRVSAGTGIHLDSNAAHTIAVAQTPKTRDADFALRVSGNSMEPLYRDGDILLVSGKKEVGVGDLGIFICDGEGYFKKFGGDCLLSLNPDYAPIPLSSFGDFSCRGGVIGTLRSRP